MKDIIKAVPLDKYFDLFKPGGVGGEGGFICLAVEYQPVSSGAAPTAAPRAFVGSKSSAPAKKGGMGGLVKVVGALALVAGAVIALTPKKKKNNRRRR